MWKHRVADMSDPQAQLAADAHPDDRAAILDALASNEREADEREAAEAAAFGTGTAGAESFARDFALYHNSLRQQRQRPEYQPGRVIQSSNGRSAIQIHGGMTWEERLNAPHNIPDSRQNLAAAAAAALSPAERALEQGRVPQVRPLYPPPPMRRATAGDFGNPHYRGALAAVSPVAPPPVRPLPLGMPMSEGRRRQMAREYAGEIDASRNIRQVARAPANATLLVARHEPEAASATLTTADDNTCNVCLVSHITTMILPCRHFLYCLPCAEIVKSTHPGTCPDCRRPIQALVQPLGKKNAADEHKRRERDPAHLEQLAAEMRSEADQLAEAAGRLRVNAASSPPQAPVVSHDPVPAPISPAEAAVDAVKADEEDAPAGKSGEAGKTGRKKRAPSKKAVASEAKKKAAAAAKKRAKKEDQ